MALALVLTSLAPAGAAQAASAMVMNVSEKILYITENAKNTPDNYDFYIKNKPEDWKSTLDFKWESSDETVATVANGGITQAVGVGVTTISCTITDKETGEEVAFTTCELTVKGIADRVEIINAPEDGIVGIGENVIDLNRAMYDEAGNRTTKRGVYVSDYTRWISSDETIATIDKNGVVTTYKEGEFTVTAETYQSKANPATNASTSITLTAQASMVSAEQLSPTKAEITFDTDMSDVVTRDNLKVSSIVGTTPVSQIVKSISWDETGKVATVEVYVDFAANTEYMFEYNGMSAGFVGAVLTADTVASIAITFNTGVVNTADAVEFKLYDANGIEITASDAIARVTMSAEDGIGYYFDSSAKEITFYEAGRTAVVTATYHTYQYSDTGVETVYTTAATIVGVNAAANLVNNISAYHVGTSVDWDGTLTNRMSTSDGNSRIFVRATMTDGTTVTNETKDNLFTFESSDSSVLIVSSNGYLYPVREGSATVIVMYDDTVVGAVTVTIIGNRTATSVTITMNQSTLSRRVKSKDSLVVTVTATDQLGAAYSTEGSKAEIIGNTSGVSSSAREVSVDADSKITFEPADFTADGTYQYRLQVGNIVRVFSFTAGMPNTDADDEDTTARIVLGDSSYNVALDISSGEVSFDDDTLVADLGVALYAENGFKIEDVDPQYIVYTSNNASETAATNAKNNNARYYYFSVSNLNGGALTGAGIQLYTVSETDVVTGGAVEKLDVVTKASAGTVIITLHSVEASGSTRSWGNSRLTITDTQNNPTVNVTTNVLPIRVSTSMSISTSSLSDVFDVRINGVKVDSDQVVIGTVVGADTGRPFIRTLEYRVKVNAADGSEDWYIYSIPVNQSFIAP